LKTVFWLQNVRGEGPQKLDAKIFMPLKGHIMWIVEKFGAIRPMDPDEIS